MNNNKKNKINLRKDKINKTNNFNINNKSFKINNNDTISNYINNTDENNLYFNIKQSYNFQNNLKEFDEINKVGSNISIKKFNNDLKMKTRDSSLDKTIKLSYCSSKVQEESELGYDEVKDIIIYYNLNNETLKNYLFRYNDYFDFINERKNKYLNFFLK